MPHTPRWFLITQLLHRRAKYLAKSFFQCFLREPPAKLRICLGANFDFYLNFWRSAKLREYRKRLIGVFQKKRVLQKWIVVTIWPVCFLPRSPDEHAVISEYEKRRDRNSVVLLTVDPQKQAQTPQTAQTTSYLPQLNPYE
jgi:hypothetical protein